MKTSLDIVGPISDSAAFQWQLARCMFDVMQAMRAYHGDDLDEALVFLTLGIQTLNAVSPKDKPVMQSLSRATQTASDYHFGLRLNEVAHLARLNRSTTRRKLDRLVQAGLVISIDATHYRVAPGINERADMVAMLERFSQAYVEMTENLFKNKVLRIDAD